MTIVLTREQLQYVLDTLAKRPYKEVADIIQSVLKQVSAASE